MREKGFAPILVLVVALVAVAIGAVAYFQIKTKTTSQTQISTQEKPSPTQATSQAQKDETANWKTYTNEELGFSVKYPQEWFLYDNNIAPCAGSIPEYVFINKSQLSNCIFADVKPADFYIFVDVAFNPLPTSNQFDIFKYYQLAGEDGVINIRTEKSEGPRGVDTRIYINHKNRGYLISFPNNDYQGNHEKVFDQILSTFKFLD